MFSGNGTIDYSVEAHTLDAHKTSAARQESTTRNLQDQAPYLRALLESLKMGECNPLSSPMVDVPLPKEEDTSPLLNEMEQSKYRSLVGDFYGHVSAPGLTFNLRYQS